MPRGSERSHPSQLSLPQRINEVFKFLAEVYDEWQKDHPELLSAALGYFMLFSLPPLLIIGAATLGYVFDDVDMSKVMEKLTPFIGRDAAGSITEWLKIAGGEGKGKATVISALVLWLGASRVFVQLRTALNVVWKVPELKRKFWRQMISSSTHKFLVVLGVSIFLLLVFAADTMLAFLNKKMGVFFPLLGNIHFWQGASLLMSFALLTVGVAAIYRYVPDAAIRWRDVWPGAVITSILLSVGKTLISLYIGFQSFSSAYGAAGSVIVIMIWIYFASQIFFFGAKLTWLYSRKYGGNLV